MGRHVSALLSVLLVCSAVVQAKVVVTLATVDTINGRSKFIDYTSRHFSPQTDQTQDFLLSTFRGDTLKFSASVYNPSLSTCGQSLTLYHGNTVLLSLSTQSIGLQFTNTTILCGTNQYCSISVYCTEEIFILPLSKESCYTDLSPKVKINGVKFSQANVDLLFLACIFGAFIPAYMIFTCLFTPTSLPKKEKSDSQF